ncbi:MAG: UDP-N-acetylmuramate--L-alanine ligase [Pseudoruegeria sp.]
MLVNSPQTMPYHVHLVGIGGVGMSSIAHYLLDLGTIVSGSDIRQNETTTKLAARGATIFYSHKGTYVQGAAVVVASDAIPSDNPEIAQARKSGIEVVKRAVFLQRFCAGKMSIHVTGTHGKSTTSAMIASVLFGAGADPSFLLGDEVHGLHSNSGKASEGAQIVVEACEAFRNLSCYATDFAVITNVDDDHIEHYGNQVALDDAFANFANQTAVNGQVFVNGDDAGVKRILQNISRKFVTFGISDSNKFSANKVVTSPQGSEFAVLCDGKKVGDVFLPVPGRHMVENALGCIAVCMSIDIEFAVISKALSTFGRVARRWKDHGVIDGVRVIEDFAHHPTALRVNIETARQLLPPGGRLVLGFQPQLYSRTQRLAKAYAEAIETCDVAFLLEIDAGGEPASLGVGNQIIGEHFSKAASPITLNASPEDLVESVASILRPDDILLLAGGADIARTALLAVSRLREGKDTHSRCTRLLSSGSEKVSEIPMSLRTENALTLIKQNFLAAPSTVAVTCGAACITYQELDVISQKLSDNLRARGIGSGSVVAIGLPPSIDQVSLHIAVLRSGGTCLTLDEKLPPDRLTFMMDVAGTDLLITQNGSRIDAGLQHPAKIHFEAMILDCIRNSKNRISTKPKLNVEPQAGDVAHICFTSGTTGWPKGIPTTHAALSALQSAAMKRFDLTNRVKTVLNSSLNFDASIAEIMLTLAAGGTLYIPETRRTLLGRELRDFINRNEITHLFATPSVLSTLSQSKMKSLQTVVSGGEVCSQDLANAMSQICNFINAYGPSEATIYSTAWQFSKDDDVCIGHPLAHVDLHILNSHGGPVKQGEIGNIFLSGIGVCEGYLGDANTYQDRFAIIKGVSGAPVQAYKTGDLGRFRADGQVEFIGRIDNQIKIRGNRIELEEIENALTRLECVAGAVVCIERTDHSSEIVAFYTTTRDNTPDGTCDINNALARSLPSYMIPSAFIMIEEIPMTLNGKKDRVEVARRHRHKAFPQAEFIAPINDTQKRLANLWQSLLKADHPIGQIHSFDGLGGDSLKQVMLTLDVEVEFNISVPPGFFGVITDLRSMARLVDELIASTANETRCRVKTSLSNEIYFKQKEFTSSWVGIRHEPESLIVSAGPLEAEHNLFWCLQSGDELAKLATALGSTFRVHGMRSGHLVMTYSDENLKALSDYYAWEIDKFYPTGTLYFGGNCQGGQVAHAVAVILQRQGRDVRLLILMEQARFPQYVGRLAFIYGEDSFLNPHKRYDNGLANYDRAYPHGYSLNMIPGTHGQFFNEPNVLVLAEKIKSNVEKSKD